MKYFAETMKRLIRTKYDQWCGYQQQRRRDNPVPSHRRDFRIFYIRMIDYKVKSLKKKLLDNFGWISCGSRSFRIYRFLSIILLSSLTITHIFILFWSFEKLIRLDESNDTAILWERICRVLIKFNLQHFVFWISNALVLRLHSISYGCLRSLEIMRKSGGTGIFLVASVRISDGKTVIHCTCLWYASLHHLTTFSISSDW